MPPIIKSVTNAIGAPVRALQDLVSSHVSYTAPVALPTTPTVKVATPPPLATLPSGAKIAPVPQQWTQAISKAYQNYPAVPKGLIEAVLHQESSMGTNKTNYNPDIGEHAYLAGLTNNAKQELIRRGYNPDFNTPEGTINAVAAYLNFVKDRHDAKGRVVNTVTDPVELYNDYYKTDSGIKLSKKQLKDFKNLVNYYAQPTPTKVSAKM